MTTQKLVAQIRKKKSFLCIGLDVDIDKIPSHLLKEEDPIFSFNKAIIDATHQFCVAYKPNTAFYEAYGLKGWQSLEKTIRYLNENYPEIFTIADAKRGDIGEDEVDGFLLLRSSSDGDDLVGFCESNMLRRRTILA